MKYYKGIYADASQLAGVSPARTWVLRTGTNGTAYLNAAYLVSGDPFYYAGNGDPTLPLGTVTIQETKAPVGYLINSELFLRQITSQGTAESVRTYNAPVVPDKVVRGGVSIEKWDFDLNRKNAPQGDASLSGAVFEIYNRSTNSVVVDGKTYAPGAVVHTMTTDATGTATTANDLLPYGQYEIIEKAPPEGYLNTGVIRQTLNIADNGVIVSLKTSNTAIKNNVIRGGVETEKWDIERSERTLKQGDATLLGAVLEIWNRSANSVVVGGVEYAPNTVVHTMTTDADGWAGTTNDLLPYGTYEIVEKTPPTGYLNTGVIRQAFQIKEHGAIVSMKASEDVIQNNIIRGGIRVEKWDNEIDEHRPQGGATFEGAVFEIVNRSMDSVLVQDVLCAPGEVVYTFATDATGAALTPSNLLPYGTYEVRETNPPAGYLATGMLSRTFTIRDHGMIVHLNTSDTAIKNDPIRGDLKGVKISDGNAKRLANVPFRITSATTGESHVIVTDINGEFNTASNWNPHSQNTNRGETDRDGIWFGELRVLNDDLGALLYDTYIMEELRCEANREYELLTFTVSIYRHNTVVDLGTLTDDYIQVPEIFTTARDQATNTGSAYVSEKTTIIDTVYYSGLKAGQEYTLKGTLMDKTSGEPLLVEGVPVTAETTFRAQAEAGSVPMEFTFNSTSLNGKAVVVFESLEFEGAEIAAHADIEDEGQTVAFTEPGIGTSATGADGEKELDIGPKVTLIDTVSYENLIPGLPYTLKGILMDKATGKPLLIEDKEVTAEAVFKPDAPSGSAEVAFTFDATSLMGKTVVVFESLELGGMEIATHADIEDEGQTVTFRAPKIGTSAKAEDGSKTVPISQSVTVIDTVAYTGLVPNTKYVLKGTLMDKESGQPLMKDGKAVTAQTEFTPTSPSGSVDVRFTFDSRAISGRTLVVFESLALDGNEIAVHADIQDAAQAVSVDTPVPDKPETPTPTPIIPATPTGPTKPVPQTSDDNMAIIWIVVLGASLLGAIASCTVYIRTRKGRKSKRRAAVTALVLCVALLAGSGLMLAREVVQYTDSAAAYEKLSDFVQDAAPQDNAGTQEEGNTLDDDGALSAPQGAPSSSRLPVIDFGTLQRVNPDVKAWLVSEGTAINYPVVQGADNSHYLKRLYDGTRKKAGCLFIDYENEPFKDKNTIIYGHNMLDGSMFAELAGYKEQTYYEAHPDLLLVTPNGGYIVEVFAAFSASPNETGGDTSPWKVEWEDATAYAAWLEATVGRSLIQADVDVATSDQIVTLSTCIRRGHDRFLVMGRLVPVE
ncbi:class B sortase [Christensenellaceae bacterium OttesenSCG-928-L17]|nr:class B sortase [Christensenellaceae bacterium OttesenSCG-928-L17]